MGRTLIRTDRNGTEYYHCVEACGKCNGSGYIKYYSWNCDGVCFSCGGTGRVEFNEKVYTSEYLKKLKSRRIAKMKKERAEKDRRFFEANGINKDGCTWIVLGNTFKIIDEIKKLGGKYNNILGWHFDHEVEEFDTTKLTAQEMFHDTIGGYEWKVNTDKYDIETQEYIKTSEETVYDVVNRIRCEYESKRLNKEIKSSAYVAEVGDKISSTLKVDGVFSFESVYGTLRIYKFVDENSNVIVWKTSTYAGYYEGDNWVSIDTGDVVSVKGTVKELKEYKGIKQTIITRCKLSKAS